MRCIQRGNAYVRTKRSHKEHGYTTVMEHMPERHRAIAGVTSESLLARAEETGTYAVQLVKLKLAAGKYPEHAYRSCMGILNLKKKYGRERLDKACKRALHYRAMSYQNVSNMLQYKLEDEEYEKPYVSPGRHLNTTISAAKRNTKSVFLKTKTNGGK